MITNDSELLKRLFKYNHELSSFDYILLKTCISKYHNINCMDIFRCIKYKPLFYYSITDIPAIYKKLIEKIENKKADFSQIKNEITIINIIK